MGMETIQAGMMERWIESPVKWINDLNCLFVHPDTKRLEKLADNLFPFQIEILNAAAARDRDGNLLYDTIILSVPKQNGKSLIEAVWTAWRLCCFPHQVARYLANSHRQASTVGFGYLSTILEQTPAIRKYWKPYIHRRHIYLPTMQSQCEALANNPRTVSGEPTDVLIGEEVGLMDDERAFQICRSQTTPLNAQTFIASTVGTEENVLWKMILDAEEGNARKTFCRYFKDENPSPRITDEWLAERERQMPPIQFRMFHRNMPGGETEVLLAPEVVDACRSVIEPGSWNELEKLSDENIVITGAALDRATLEGADETVGVVVGGALQEGVWHYYVLECRTFELSLEEAIKSWTMDQFLRWNISEFVWEQYQTEDLYRWAENEGIPSRFEHAQGGKQLSAFTRLQTLAATGRLHIPERLTKLLRQLKFLGHKAKGSRHVQFGGTVGEHDDAVYALVWALDAVAHPVVPRMIQL